MTITVSSSAIAAVSQMFEALHGVLDKAAARCAETGVEESVYLNWRLAPDMFPLATQIRFATEIPARALSRLAGAELPSFPDDETSFAEMKARIDRAEMIIKKLDEAALDANPEANVTVPMGPMEVTLPRLVFAQNWILPNLYFHVMTAYLILRHLGVDIGKKDFLISLREYIPNA